MPKDAAKDGTRNLKLLRGELIQKWQMMADVVYHKDMVDLWYSMISDSKKRSEAKSTKANPKEHGGDMCRRVRLKVHIS